MNWNAAIAIFTAAAAVATAFMAVFTGIAIRYGQRQFYDTRTRSEGHHRDTFRPVVVLSVYEGVEPEDRGNVVQFSPTKQPDDRRLVTVSGILRNVGVGPALKVRLHFWAMDRADYGFALDLTPIAAGEKYDLAAGRLRYWVRPTPGFNDADIALAAGTNWVLVIEYEDVFGSAFHTIHRKDPRMPWTECGRGPAPRISNPEA